MLGKKVGIDLGSQSIRVVGRGELDPVCEPAVARLDSAGWRVGRAALEPSAGDQGGTAVWPFAGGQIGDAEALQALLGQLLNRVAGRQRIFKPDVVIAVPSDLSAEDRRRLLEIAARLGVRTTYLIDAPLAAGMGCNLAVAAPAAHLIVDCGGGTVDAALLASASVVSACCIHREAGQALDPALIRSAINDVLERAPPRLREEIARNGIWLVGGAATAADAGGLSGILGCPVHVASDPAARTVRGTAVALGQLDRMRRPFLHLP